VSASAPAASSGEEDAPILPAPEPTLRAVVVVPARDEADRIGACLLALGSQQRVASCDYEVIVVLDGCTDGTAERVYEIAAELPQLRLHTVALAVSAGVGRARRIGMDLACARLEAVARPHGLIASTDADSRVLEDWLAAQLDLVERGARAIGGQIELDVSEAGGLPPGALAARRAAAEARMNDVIAQAPAHVTTEHHHFSGASLAVTAEAYRDCGGLPARAALEDEALELELARRAIAIHRSASVRVLTSARTDGRAPRGLARDLALASWCARRSYRAEQFPLERLLADKDCSIALVLPAREVAATIGPIVAGAARLRQAGLLDEVLVVDAASSDGTAEVAAAAGVAVVQENDLSSELGAARGKGDAMWRALREVGSDIVVFADTDSEDFTERFITGLLGPLLCEPGVSLVKGCFRRPFRTPDAVLAAGGGRVTELLARPLLNLHAPELAGFDQPLAGELAGRRELLEQIPFCAGYGVEIAMLIDAWRIVGLDGLAQVDLGSRQNRHQPLRELSAMAYEVLVAAQSRFLAAGFADSHAAASIALPPLERGAAMEARRVTIEERPPLRRRQDGGSCDDRLPARLARRAPDFALPTAGSGRQMSAHTRRSGAPADRENRGVVVVSVGGEFADELGHEPLERERLAHRDPLETREAGVERLAAALDEAVGEGQER
jgi:glucosyl-3-phosphoglycerate synthase